jgi:hypothetical protein
MSPTDAKAVRKLAKKLLGSNRAVGLEPTPGYIFSIQRNRVGFKIVVVKLKGYDSYQGKRLHAAKMYNFVPFMGKPVCSQLVYSVDPRTGMGGPVGMHTMSERMKVGWHVPDNGGPTASPDELEWLLMTLYNINETTKLA